MFVIWILIAIFVVPISYDYYKKLAKSKDIKNIKIKRILLVIATVLLVGLMLLLTFMDLSPLKRYKDYDKFSSKAVLLYNLPDGAENLRMASYDFLVSKQYFLSYELDDDEMAAFIESVTEEVYQVTNEDGTTDVVPDEFYGISVSEIQNVDSYHEFDGSSPNYPFDSVIDDSIYDYTVICYRPLGISATNYGLFYNEDTNRVIYFYVGNIK